MFDLTHHTDALDIARSLQFSPLRAFLDEHHDALLDAAGMLGGRQGVRLAQSVLEDLTDEPSPSRRVMRAVVDLRDLLMLENVHDPSREESARFAAIDPADSCVEEICLLADGLCDAIDACGDVVLRRVAA